MTPSFSHHLLKGTLNIWRITIRPGGLLRSNLHRQDYHTHLDALTDITNSDVLIGVVLIVVHILRVGRYISLSLFKVSSRTSEGRIPFLLSLSRSTYQNGKKYQKGNSRSVHMIGVRPGNTHHSVSGQVFVDVHSTLHDALFYVCI